MSALETLFEAAYERHTKSLTFQELRKGITAVSSLYVERRDKMAEGDTFAGAGKRGAFAAFFGPMHFAMVQHVVGQVCAADKVPAGVQDLGCGTAASGAAWALHYHPAVALTGVDSNTWAVAEAQHTCGDLQLRGRFSRGDFSAAQLTPNSAVLCAFSVNELSDSARRAFLEKLLAHHRSGGMCLVLEPLAKRDRPWWDEWELAFNSAGGRSDVWRFQSPMPEQWHLLDKAAGLRHTELSVRSLALV